MSLMVRPMREDELERWLPRATDEYVEDMVRYGGALEDEARAKAAADMERLFPGGRPAPGRSIYVLEAGGRPVGELWIGRREGDPLGDALWVYSVRIDEDHRGRGYGRAAMLFAEEEARRLGFPRIALNVFGGNAVARGLYRSLGYEETAVVMRKRV